MPDAAGAERTAILPDPLPRTPANPAERVAELQVSAHLMTLDAGLFCIFQTPGSPSPDAATGLPGVRITPAPGITGRPEAVSVSTFREDGWLNGTAALVRITDGSAQVLVSIYQHKGMDAAPSLQVLRLSGDPNAAAPQGVATEPTAVPAVNPEVMAHVQRMGDVGCMLGEWIGAKGSRQWVEASASRQPARSRPRISNIRQCWGGTGFHRGWRVASSAAAGAWRCRCSG
jgi:hypothetical protein